MSNNLIEARAEWFALAMNAAASLEDAANCLRDTEAKAAALGAAKHIREKCDALWSAHRSQQEAQAASDNQAFEKGYAQGRADQQQIQEARSQQEAAQEPEGRPTFGLYVLDPKDSRVLTAPNGDGTHTAFFPIKEYTASPAQSESEALKAAMWDHCMDWGTRDFSICKRVGATGACWEPIKTSGPVEAAVARNAALSASGQK